jgi:hypothetical protein
VSTVRLYLAFEEAKHPRDKAGRFRDLLNHIEDALHELNAPSGHYGRAGQAIARARSIAPNHPGIADAAAAHRAQDPAAVERHLTHAMREAHRGVDAAAGDLGTMRIPAQSDLKIRLRKPRPAPLPKPPAGIKTSLITVRRHNGDMVRHTALQPGGGYVGHVHEDDPTHFTVLIPTRMGGVEQRTFPTLVEALHALEHGSSHAPGPPRKRIRKEAHV